MTLNSHWIILNQIIPKDCLCPDILSKYAPFQWLDIQSFSFFRQAQRSYKYNLEPYMYMYNLFTVSTSSCAMVMSSVTLEKTVGWTKLPLSATRPPPQCNVAPCFLPVSIRFRILLVWVSSIWNKTKSGMKTGESPIMSKNWWRKRKYARVHFSVSYSFTLQATMVR